MTGSPESINAMETELRAQERWSELCDLLHAHIEQTDDAGELEARYQSLIAVLRDQLADVDEAYQAGLAGLRALPQSAIIADAITALIEENALWAEALGEVTELAQATHQPADAVALWMLLGRWYGDHLKHYGYAAHSCNMALKLDPDNIAVRAARDRFQEAEDRLT